MNEGIHLDLDTWIVPGQIRKSFNTNIIKSRQRYPTQLQDSPLKLVSNFIRPLPPKSMPITNGPLRPLCHRQCFNHSLQSVKRSILLGQISPEISRPPPEKIPHNIWAASCTHTLLQQVTHSVFASRLQRLLVGASSEAGSLTCSNLAMAAELLLAELIIL